jgi:hypothetical protein
MTSTKTGSRTSWRTQLRMRETVTLEATSTAVVASPSPMPLIRVLETASRGQSPSSATSAWLLVQSPSVRILR